MRVGKVRLSLSYRQWAEAAGVSKSVVGRYSPSLTPWIVRHCRGSRATGTATVWQIGRPPKRENWDSRAAPDGMASGLSQEPRLPAAGSIVDPALDQYYRRSSAWVIASHLDPDGGDAKVPEFVAATGLHPSTVRANLRYLASLGLVERIDRFSWRGRREAKDANRLAALRCYANDRRRRHSDERASYRRGLTDPETGERLFRHSAKQHQP
jgi:hypothetical protein